MQLKFEGQTHSIDANTLINVLTYYQMVLQEANTEYGGGSREVTLNINALEQGSFVIDVEVVQNIAQQLFSRDTAEYIANLVAIVGGIYGAYRVFKGKPIKNRAEIENNGIIINGNVNINTIVNIYNKKTVRGVISKSIEAADADSNVEGFSIMTEQGDNVYFDKNEFKDYIYDDFDLEEELPSERCLEEDATMTIIGLNFEPGSNWQFMYNGFKITIRVKDDALMQKINEGERFGKGDAIKVKLRIIQKYNKTYKAYENKGYKIVEFYDHIIPQQPKDLFESKEE